MRKRALRTISAGLSLVLLTLCASCSFENNELAVKMFKNREKICFSTKYTALKETKNSADSWRDGMISGNGEQGFITSGAPYSDSIIYQNAGFAMPTVHIGETAAEPLSAEEVRQMLVNGQTVPTGAAPKPDYEYHPGGALRITSEKQRVKKYIRYTDYESGEVGEVYQDKLGTWERRSFTSFADNAVFTRIASTTGAKVNVTLSFDDIASMANFGVGLEKDARVRRIADANANYIAFVGHYPALEGSPLKNSGWMTFVRVSTEGGEVSRAELEKNEKTVQDVSDGNYGLRISNAYAVHLIAFSLRIDDLGPIETFADGKSLPAVRKANRTARALERRYRNEDGLFDYDQALKAHTDIYTPLFNRVTLTLGEGNPMRSNDGMIRSQRRTDALEADYAQKVYYAGRYAMLCSAGAAAYRSAGMWTGEFNPGWGGVYDLAAGVGLQAAALPTADMPEAAVSYARFLLRQAPAWENNAAETHGFRNALQAPLYTVGADGLPLTAENSAASRYWNAGAAALLRPLYEALLSMGDLEIPLDESTDPEALRSVLNTSAAPLSGDWCEEVRERGYLRLQEDVLFPLLLKTANYWLALVSPAYYTDAEGNIRYESGKTALGPDETYCLLPGYSPATAADIENNQLATDQIGANAAVDIAACRDTLGMLQDVATRMGLDWTAAEEPAADAGDDAEADEETEPAGEAETETDAGEPAAPSALSPYAALLERLPAYRNDDSGTLQRWAVAGRAANDGGMSLPGSLSFAWPFAGAQENPALKEAGGRTLRTLEGSVLPGTSLLRRGLIAARLQDRKTVTQSLLAAERKKIRYASFMTAARSDGKRAYNADYAVGYAALINEALVQSGGGGIVLLPAVPESGFDVGSMEGLRTLNGVTVTLMSWDLSEGYVIADLTADVTRMITVSSPLSEESVTLTLEAGVTATVSLILSRDGETPAQTPTAETAAPAESAAAEDVSAEDGETETGAAAEYETRPQSEYDRYNAELYDYGAARP